MILWVNADGVALWAPFSHLYMCVVNRNLHGKFALVHKPEPQRDRYLVNVRFSIGRVHQEYLYHGKLARVLGQLSGFPVHRCIEKTVLKNVL